ncbi:MAG TPA: cytochrome c oxidase subunit I [Thermoanaerobaculia bacterium]|nr:cytochrome c oxidase subunit I [Thermoanaerobaculia bacterium]
MDTANTPAVEPMPELELPRTNYLNAAYGPRSWLFTRDHKRIAILYLASVTAFFALGGFFALLIRLELLTPEGDLVGPDTYNKLFTMHGIVMVFFFLIPSIPAVLGNFLVPLMIGAKDLAFPKLNLASWYVYNLGAIFTLWSIIHGGVDTGWTFYTPFSTTYSNSYVVSAALGIFIAGFSSIMTGLNFIVTIHRLRAPGLTWFRLPLFLWSMYATSLIMVLGTPVIAITLLLVAAERVLHLGIFDPALGGDPVLYQHLFWFYSHPAVYIMILPAMGVTSELVAAFSRRAVVGYRVVAFASVAIAVLGFLVWGHHMFVAGESVYAATIFSVLSMLVAIPSAVKVFNWTATLYGGAISLETPMLYALGFIGLFTIGGLTGVMVATLGFDVHVHDTYFVVAHFHYIMVGGAIMGYMGGLHYWWPKISGRLYPVFLSRLAALLIFVGFNLTFFPQFILGYLGMPRRYWSYPPEFQVLNVLSTAGASVLGLGYLLPAAYFIWSMRYGKLSPANPWGAVGLEWDTDSPPPTHNFDVTPIVTRGPYDYGQQPALAPQEAPVG